MYTVYTEEVINLKLNTLYILIPDLQLVYYITG